MSLERGRSRYVGGAPPSHHKIAERITILNKRAPGMLTRLFNLKKQVNEPKNKPDFFKRKDVQPYLQQITKKFPNVGPSQMSFPQIQQGESSLISELSFFNLENDFSSKTETRLLLAKVNLYMSSNSIPVYTVYQREM